jgi:hypothetical protein
MTDTAYDFFVNYQWIEIVVEQGEGLYIYRMESGLAVPKMEVLPPLEKMNLVGPYYQTTVQATPGEPAKAWINTDFVVLMKRKKPKKKEPRADGTYAYDVWMKSNVKYVFYLPFSNIPAFVEHVDSLATAEPVN